jgi:hypothetical protein
MKIRYYCFNSDCPVTELQLQASLEAKCPCCEEASVPADEYDADAQHEYEMAKAHDEEQRRIYGCPYEDMQSMNYRPQLITNEDGEPIGWG